MSEDSEMALGESLHAMAQDIKERDEEIERLRDVERMYVEQFLDQERVATEQAKEIERLRGLLREVADGYLRATYGSSHEDVAQINDIWRQVKEALGHE
jgi:hypothetical protein